MVQTLNEISKEHYRDKPFDALYVVDKQICLSIQRNQIEEEKAKALQAIADSSKRYSSTGPR